MKRNLFPLTLLILLVFSCFASSNTRIAWAVNEEDCKNAGGICREYTGPLEGETSLGTLDCHEYGTEYGYVQAICCKRGTTGCNGDFDPCNEPVDCCSQICEFSAHHGKKICQPAITAAPPSLPKTGKNMEKIDFNQLGKAIPNLKPLFQPGSNLGAIISAILPYLFVIAGLLLLFYLIAGGFQMMISANDEKGLASAKGKITNALVGFLLLFISYWLVQIIEVILGIKIF
jgi:hypothetical protein